jgi:CIC family chloride channel protein
MGGTMQVPLTAVIFVLELTGDVTALPGLLVGSVAAAGVTVLLMRRSILTEKLARRGQHVTREYGVNPLHVLRVEEVMEPPLATPAGTGDVVAFPDELLETAMSKLLEHELEGLPVASRDDPAHMVGYVERAAILAAWVQLTRDEHTIEEGWLGRLRRAPR